jgi:hypothetical protein
MTKLWHGGQNHSIDIGGDRNTPITRRGSRTITWIWALEVVQLVSFDQMV